MLIVAIKIYIGNIITAYFFITEFHVWINALKYGAEIRHVMYGSGFDWASNTIKKIGEYAKLSCISYI